MKRLSPSQFVFLLLRLVLGGVFLWAGVVKIYDFEHGGSATQDFWQDIMNYQLVSTDVAQLTAIYLPWLEVVAGGALVLGRSVAGAALLCSTLTVVFMGGLASAWSRGLDISCGCFGREEVAANYPLHLAGNVVLLVVGVALLWRAQYIGRRAALFKKVVSLEDEVS